MSKKGHLKNSFAAAFSSQTLQLHDLEQRIEEPLGKETLMVHFGTSSRGHLPSRVRERLLPLSMAWNVRSPWFRRPTLGRRFDYTATADLAMSAAVYAVHAAQWAQRGALSAPGPRREFFSQLRLRLLRQVPDAPLRCAGWKEVAYGTMLRQWEEEQAKILAKTWKGRLQATKGRLGPVVVSCTSSVAVFITSDLMVQKAVEKRPEVDVTRTSVMGLFGLGYAGFAQHFLYTRLWPFILQAARLSGPRAVAFQVLGDQGFYMPLIYLPIFYSTKEMACTNKLLWETAQAGVLRWQENLAADLTLCSGYWIPVQALTFGLVPIGFRVFFMSFASLIFQVGLQTAMLRRQT